MVDWLQAVVSPLPPQEVLEQGVDDPQTVGDGADSKEGGDGSQLSVFNTPLEHAGDDHRVPCTSQLLEPEHPHHQHQPRAVQWPLQDSQQSGSLSEN